MSGRAARPDPSPRPARETAEPAIRSVILSKYAQVATAAGLDPAAMLARLGIDTICLVDPNVPIPVTRAIALIEISAIDSGRADFGMQLATARGVPDIGPLALLIREEPDLGGALRSLHHYLPVHSRSMRIVLTEQEDIALLTNQFAALPEGRAAVQTTEMVICGLIHFVRWLVGPDWAPLMACFAHPAPQQLRQHRDLLNCPVEFGQSFDGLVLARADLDRPIFAARPLARDYAEQYVRSLEGAAQSDIVTMVRDLITALLPLGRCSVVVVARHLGLDRSTLSRRLAVHGTSYSVLLNECRMAIASRSCHPGRPLSELADLLGFSSLSTFSRWFSRAFGQNAREWREGQNASA